MVFHIITQFPEMIENYLKFGILSRAAGESKIHVETHDPRKYPVDRYGHIDGRVFGGGKGMLYRPEPLDETIAEIRQTEPETLVVSLTPQGVPLTNRLVRRLAKEKSLTLLSSRYEGIDARVTRQMVDLEVSIGDYVLTGGELPALVLLDAVSRFVEGTIKTESADCDSFENGLLEYEHYTDPLEFRGEEVPEVLRSGNHKDIEAFRRASSLRKTYMNRPDLIRDLETPCQAGETSHPVRKLQRTNRQRLEYCLELEKIAKEWKYVRRNPERSCGS